MLPKNRFVPLFVLTLVAALLLAACGGAPPPPSATPVSSLTPRQIVDMALKMTEEHCKDLGANQACYGYAGVEVKAARADIKFAASGDKVNLADLQALSTKGLDEQAGTWGVVKISAAFNLPAGQQATFLVFGDTSLDSFKADMSEMTFRTGSGNPQNADEPLPLVLVQVPKGQKITFKANGVEITLGSTAILEAVPDKRMGVSVLEGQGQVTAMNASQAVTAGAQVVVPLSGSAPNGAPSAPMPIPAERLRAAPVAALPQQVAMDDVAVSVNLVGTQVAQAGQTLTAAAPMVIQAALTLTANAKQGTQVFQQAPETVTPSPGAPVAQASTPQASMTPRPTWTPGPTLPPISPTTAQIAFATNRDGKWEIYVMDADGGHPLRLTNRPGDNRAPSWSPDGKQIAFAGFTGSMWQIYTVNVDGSGLKALTQGNDSATAPAWSPDGKQVAFELLRDNSRSIWVMAIDGSTMRSLESKPADGSEPSWSPDGKRIAFVSNRDGNPDIYAVNIDGSGLIRLTNSAAEEHFPSWSPDGQQIAFASDRSGNSEIYVMEADGSNLKRLTSNPARDESPVWSTDGTQITFVSDRDGSPAIYVMDTTGNEVRRLTDLASDNRDPAWKR